MVPNDSALGWIKRNIGYTLGVRIPPVNRPFGWLASPFFCSVGLYSPCCPSLPGVDTSPSSKKTPGVPSFLDEGADMVTSGMGSGVSPPPDETVGVLLLPNVPVVLGFSSPRSHCTLISGEVFSDGPVF